MDNDYVEFTSLCSVISRLDKNGNYMLKRLADVEKGKLIPPQKSERPIWNYENRSTIYWSDGPNQVDDVAVWQWSAKPAWDNPVKDTIRSKCMPEYIPTFVVLVNEAISTVHLKQMLRQGINRELLYNCDVFFCHPNDRGQYAGVVYSRDDLDYDGRTVSLKKDAPSGRPFACFSTEVFFLEDKRSGFLRTLGREDIAGRIEDRDINAVVRSALLNRLTWRSFNEMTQGTKAEWNKCKAILDTVSRDSLYETVAEELDCSIEDAETVVKEFIRHANELLDQGNIDKELLADLVKNHDGLRTEGYRIAEENWQKSHASQRQTAQRALDKIQKDISKNERIMEDITAQISSKKKSLSEVSAELEKYEKLKESVIQSIHEKLESARADVGGLLTEMSVFLPQGAASQPENKAGWKYYAGSKAGDETPDSCDNWEDTLSLLKDNLHSAFYIKDRIAKMLAAFLYSAYNHRASLLIAGPCAKALADAISVSVVGETAGVLELGESNDYCAAEDFEKADDSIVVIQNMFQAGWNDNWLEKMSGHDMPGGRKTVKLQNLKTLCFQGAA